MNKITTNHSKVLLKLFCCFIFAFILVILRTDCVMAVTDGKLYLSDIANVDNMTKIASGHLLKKDKNDSDKLITLKVNDESKVFIKGITAWASSEVVYDLSGYNYDYFTSYIGVDISEQSDYFNTGVKFKVCTSQDGQTWTDKYVSTTAFYGWSNAELIRVDLEGARYLKLVTDNNSPNWWAEWYDEAIFADAKLLKNGYIDTNTSEPVEFIKTVEEYDAMLKAFDEAGATNTDEYELTLLQREFVNNFNYPILLDFVNCNEEYKDTVKWLMTSLTNMRLYIFGGEPDGNYISSMQALNSIYQKYKMDLENKEKTASGMEYGALYRKMMITLSLTHSAQVALWMDTTSPENQSTAVSRYEIFKELHKSGAFIVCKNEDGSIKKDNTALFESLEVEEMRYVLNNIIDDESIVWLNEYTQRRMDEHPDQEETYLTPHPYMKYIWPDYAKPEYHNPDNYSLWDNKYEGVFSKYDVTYRSGVYKLWMNMEGGAVCGGISKIGSNIRGVNGIPSSVISQPGHAALIYYRQDDKGNGYWTIDNDVSGWSQSGKTEKLSVRMPLGWGSDAYVDGWAATYIVLAQEALNNYNDYTESMKYVYLANTYTGDTEKQLALYRKALEIQAINIDAWYGIIKLYEEDANTSEEKYFALAEEIAGALKCYPLPMYNLTNVIGKHLKSTEYNFKFTILQSCVLTEGTGWTNPSERSTVKKDYYTQYVYQPSITQTVSKFLLGQMDSELATFSFDGDNANNIVLSSRYDDSGLVVNYTLSGKDTPEENWIDVTFVPNEAHKIPLTDEQIASISAENDIYIHIEGLPYTEENLYKIDITTQELSENLYANDLENRIVGIDSSITQWRYVENVNNEKITTVTSVNEISNNESWTSFASASPKLNGDVSIEVRQAATGTKLASSPIRYDFTSAGESDYTKRYVPVSHLSIVDVSSEEPNHAGSASNAIDGNYNTRYHSNWNGQDDKRFMVIKVDNPIYLSAIEFVPGGGGNGKIVDGTVYGKLNEEDEWKVLSTCKDWSYTSDVNAADFGLRNIKTFEIEEPQEVQYIKIVADKTNGNWFVARMFNIFQDVSKNPHPTAGVDFSIETPTQGNVEARLTNFSTDIENIEMIAEDDKAEEHIIVSEDKMSCIFTDNGKYVFKFLNKQTGNSGSVEANVTWIDRVAPTATIKYSTTDITEGEVVAELIPSENITITNNAHNAYNENGKLYTFTQNGEFEFQFEDAAGNKGTALAKVNWINSSAGGTVTDGPELVDPKPDDSEQTNPGEQEQKPSDSEQTNPGEQEQKPSDSEQTNPGEQEQKPSDSEQTNPGEQEQKPGDSEQTNPGEQEQKPGDSEQTNPGEQEQKPSDSEQTNPGEQEQKPSDNEQTIKSKEENQKANENITENKTSKQNEKIITQNNNTKLENTVDTTMSKKLLPHTGSKTFLITAIVITVIISFIFYIKYKSIGRRSRK